MATQPQRPAPGTPILQWCSRLWDYAISLRPVAGPGIICRASRNGTIISAAGQPAAAAAATASHPWRIVVEPDGEDLAMTVGYGAVTATFAGESPPDALPWIQDIQPAWDSGESLYLRDDPFHPGTPGSETLAADASYGVWLVTGFTAGEGAANPFPNTSEIGNVYTWLPGSSAWIVVTTDTLLSPIDRYTGAAGECGIFLGRVDVDAEGIPTVFQHRRSDIHLPLVLWPRGIIFPPPPE
jgi:hypothetical protein